MEIGCRLESHRYYSVYRKTWFYDAWFYVQKYPTGKFSFHILWPSQEYNILGYFATRRRRIRNFRCVQPKDEGREEGREGMGREETEGTGREGTEKEGEMEGWGISLRLRVA